MQTVIYLDVLILLNTLISFFILISTAELMKTDIRPLRLLAGSIAGGFSSFLILIPELNTIVMLFIRVIINFLIIAVVFRLSDIRAVIKGNCLSLIITLLFGGTVYFFIILFRSEKAYINNGFVYFDIGVLGIITLITVAFVVFRIINRLFLNKKSGEIIYDVKLKIRGNEINFKALFDTGNDIKDAYTGKPVVLVSFSEIKCCFDELTCKKLTGVLNEIKEFELPDKFRLLPVRTLGAEKLLPSFSADEAVIQNINCKKYISKPTVAITNNRFDQKYSAIINKSAIGEYLI